MDSQGPLPEQAPALRHHGGNINAARRLFPDAPEPWIDLSTGVNPVPYPVGAVSQAAWTRLPDAAGLASLEAAARAAYDAPPSAGIVAAPGTQSLIQWLPRIFAARRVGVLGLTYQEHEASWRAAGADVTTVPRLSDLAAFDVAVVVNPNNPDGKIASPADLAAVAATLAQHDGRLIVDEAFIDALGPHNSLIPALPHAGAVVLRSFGKIYGLAGLRLGFAAAAAEDCVRIRSALGPWPVSGPAIEIGRLALADAAWLAHTTQRLHQEAHRLDSLLQSAGFEIVGGTPLFRLARHPAATGWFRRLCRAGILTRPFQARPDWLRFGIPHVSTDWTRLQAALLTR